MGEISMEATTVNKFISSLSKSIQALCHGCMDFDTSIEMIGYININIDSEKVVDCVLNEKVKKSTANSITCVSNSFPAKKDKPKQTKDSSCSPISFNKHQPHPSYNKRQSDDRQDNYHGFRKKQRHHQRIGVPTSSYDHGSTTESSYHEQSVASSSELILSEPTVKTEMQKDISANYDPSVPSSSHEYSIKTEPDVTVSETLQDTQDMRSESASLDINSESFSQEPCEQQSTDLNTDTSIHNDQNSQEFQLEGDKHASSFLGPEENQDAQASSNQQYSEYGGQEDSNEDAQFEVIEIGDDDEDVQGLFHQPGTSWQHDATLFQTRRITQTNQMRRNVSNLTSPGSSKPSSWSCPICQAQFVSHKMVTWHMMEEHGQRYLSCHLCGKHFTSQSGLRHHIKAHSGRRFKCHVCHFKFTHKHHLKSHLKSLHKLALCTQCSRCFSSIGDEFQRHLLSCGEFK